jgi:hypothetical protein
VVVVVVVVLVSVENGWNKEESSQREAANTSRTGIKRRTQNMALGTKRVERFLVGSMSSTWLLDQLASVSIKSSRLFQHRLVLDRRLQSPSLGVRAGLKQPGCAPTPTPTNSQNKGPNKGPNWLTIDSPLTAGGIGIGNP